MHRKTFIIGLFTIIAAGVALRLMFISDGLPYRYGFDENNSMSIVMSMLSQRSLDPGWYGHPSHTIFYLLAAISGLLFMAGTVTGIFSSSADFAAWYHSDPTVVYLLGRTAIILVSALLIAVTAMVAKTAFNARTALVAAAIVAVAPLHVEHSALIRSSDIVMSLFMMLSTWFALSILTKQAQPLQRLLWPYLMAGFCLGYAVASKYYGIAAVAAILAAHLLRFGVSPNRFSLLIAAGAASLAGCFLAAPYLFLNFSGVLNDVIIEARPTHLGAIAPGFWEDIAWFIRVLAANGIGVLLLLCAAAGTVLGWRQQNHNIIVLTATPLLLLVFLSTLSLRWERWTLALIPYLAIIAAHFLDHFIGSPSRKKTYRKAGFFKLALFSLIVVCMAQPIYQTLQKAAQLKKADARTVAHDWILNNIPAGSRILVEMHGPQLSKSRYSIFSISQGQLERVPSTGGFEHFAPWSNFAQIDAIDTLYREGMDYVVLSSTYTRMEQSSHRDQYQPQLSKYHELLDSAFVEFDSNSVDGVRGPVIRVLRLPESEYRQAEVH